MAEKHFSTLGRLPIKFFRRIQDGHNYEILPNVLPSEALKSIFTSLSIFECNQARVIALFKTILTILGEEKFNHLFNADSSTPMVIGGNSPLSRLFDSVTVKKPEDLKPGDFLYAPNIRRYLAKHPLGEGRGFNGIYLGNQHFAAMGMPPEGIPFSKMNEFLCNVFKEPLDKCFAGDC